VESADAPGKLVFETEGLTKAYGDRLVIRDFSTRVMRGDRIGLIGPNGAGKTTLLRLLLGEVAPDAGTVRRGANVQVAYYDQQREQLDPERTVVDTVGDGNDRVTVAGRTRHVHGYLEDFLFPPERARSPVKALSGGERNRLLLARLFARPANLLVMDEPTNDLDLETLELLEDLLLEYDGTLLLVSHDRELLNNVVTSTLALEGDGRVGEYAGGYDDWERQRPEPALETPAVAATAAGATAPQSEAVRSERPRKLTYKEQRELETLPARIEALEAEQDQLYRYMAAPATYQAGGGDVMQTTARLAAIEQELAEAYARWEALEAKA
jgi:ATP-binding cassette subfamily F protein uup